MAASLLRERPTHRLRSLTGAALGAILAIGLIIPHLWTNTLPHDLAAAVADSVGRLGWLPFLGLQTLIVISGILPASVVGMAAGMAYGLFPGLALATISVMVGAITAFLLSRSLLRPFVARRLQRNDRMGRLDKIVARDGWKIVCLLRVSPIMPFAATSYGLGLSSISFVGYGVGTLASLPALFGYVLIGTLARDGLDTWSGASSLRSAMIAIGIVTTLVLLVRLGWIVTRCGLISENLFARARNPGRQIEANPDFSL